MWSLRARLTLSYVLVALLCLLLVFALANGVLESEFRRYVRDSQEERSRQLVDLVGRQLRPDGTWNEAGLEAVGMSALEQGMIVRVRGADGQTVWDALVHNNGMCQQMITHMAANMTSRYPNWQGSLTEAPFPLVKGTVSTGSVTIATWGPFFLNDEDLAFITTLNRLLLWVTLAVLAVAVVVGLVMARGISVPLARVAAATQSIAAGNLDVRIGEKTRVREIAALTTAVNGLSRGLREQEALRRRLTADVAHELRTPLAALQSHLEALIDGVWQPDSHRLGSLHEEILRINRLVQDLESLARQESGAADLHRRPADLSRLVQTVVTNCRAAVPFPGHHPSLCRRRGVRAGRGGSGQGEPGPAQPGLERTGVHPGRRISLGERQLPERFGRDRRVRHGHRDLPRKICPACSRGCTGSTRRAAAPRAGLA